MVIVNSTIRNNRANDDAGGISVNDALIIRNSTISSNTADENGGGVDVDKGSVQIFDSVIDGNTAGGQGGGLYDVNLVSSGLLVKYSPPTTYYLPIKG